jgi:hypothetical protein
MGLINKVIDALKGQVAYDLTFVPSVPAKDAAIAGIGEPIEADSCYLELYLESLRLEKARKFATQFHAVVYLFVSLSREGEKRAELAALSKPEKLAVLDKDAVGKVITISKQMMGATPFRGNPVSLELGLFSVKSGNLLSPILDYVARVSSTAGISYVGVIKPFLPLITEGMDLIAGQRQDTALEVGIETDLGLDRGCVMAVIDRPKGSFDPKRLSLDFDHRLLLDGKVLECGYAVFSLRPTKKKSDYGEIPQLRERYAEFISAINKGKQSEAKEALGAFRLAVIASADLIDSDQQVLIAKANKKYDTAFPSNDEVVRITKSFRKVTSLELADIGLYE